MQRQVVKQNEIYKSGSIKINERRVQQYRLQIDTLRQKKHETCGITGYCGSASICRPCKLSEITHVPPLRDDKKVQISPTRKIVRQTIKKHPIQCRRTGEEGLFLSEVIELSKEQLATLGGKNRELVMKLTRLGDIKVI